MSGQYRNNTAREARLRRLLDDPEALLTIGANVVRSLLDHDRAETYLVERGTVRTKPVRCGDHRDVKGGQ